MGLYWPEVLKSGVASGLEVARASKFQAGNPVGSLASSRYLLQFSRES
jgi:hypothetical protein